MNQAVLDSITSTKSIGSPSGVLRGYSQVARCPSVKNPARLIVPLVWRSGHDFGDERPKLFVP